MAYEIVGAIKGASRPGDFAALHRAESTWVQRPDGAGLWSTTIFPLVRGDCDVLQAHEGARSSEIRRLPPTQPPTTQRGAVGEMAIQRSGFAGTSCTAYLGYRSDMNKAYT